MSHLRIAVRSLRRNGGATLINLTGLTIGMTCCLLMAIYVRQELSYDRFFPNADQVFRVTSVRSFPNATVASAATPRPLASALAEEMPDVAAATRISRERADRVLIQSGDQRFYDEHFLFADPNVFDVLSMPLVVGYPATVLADERSLVISSSVADVYFHGLNPVGQRILVRLQGDSDFFEYRVTGVMADLPSNSHLAVDFLATYRDHPLVGEEDEQQDWGGLNLYTYVRLRNGTNAGELERDIPGLIARRAAPEIEQSLGISYEAFVAAGNQFGFRLQPLTSIHLESGLQDELSGGGSRIAVYGASAIALIILILACFNFMNLATAQAVGRSKEIGVRKTLGSGRSQIVAQFLTESVLLCLLAAVFAAIMTDLLLPFFSSLAAIDLGAEALGGVSSMIWLVGAGVVVGLFAGLYPAAFLSRYAPTDTLKGSAAGGSGGGASLRNSLVILQFGVSAALIACTIVVYSQLRFVAGRSLGFEEGAVVLLEGTEVLRGQMPAFKEALLRNPDITSVASTQAAPGGTFDQADIRLEDSPETERITVSWMTTNPDFVETIGLEVTSGRSFSATIPGDSMAAMLNERAVRALGLTDPLGKVIIYEGRPYTVIGTVGDFHYASLHREIGPFVLFGPDPFNAARPNLRVAVRVLSDNLESTLAFMDETWTRFVPSQPMAYSFVDEAFERAYRSDRVAGRLLAAFAGLAVFIACIGLLGLASYVTRRRTKEIGIRKVMGAGVGDIVTLLSIGFLRPVVIAFLLSLPLSFLAMSRWLDNFAYRVDLSVFPFLAAGVAVIGIAFVSMSFHSIRTALADPVESLRYE